MSKLGILRATALSLALAVATPAFAAGLHGVGRGGAMHVRSGGFRSAPVVSSADASGGSRGGHGGGFGGGFGGGGYMGGFGGGAHINGVGVGQIGEIGGGVRVGGAAVGGMGHSGADHISLGDHGVDDRAMHRFGKSWSGYSLYAYDPDCNDFFFRHPDYPWLSACN